MSSSAITFSSVPRSLKGYRFPPRASNVVIGWSPKIAHNCRGFSSNFFYDAVVLFNDYEVSRIAKIYLGTHVVRLARPYRGFACHLLIEITIEDKASVSAEVAGVSQETGVW